MKALFLILLILSLILAGCTGPTTSITSTPAASSTPTHPPAAAPDPTLTPTGPVTLTIWLPPQFDPDADTPAGAIFHQRLDDYHARRPDVRIEVRLKAADGPGGLLDSLTAASAAAQLALPDLVALPRPLLETAALKGLLHPFDDLIPAGDDPDWFPYARQLARLQDSIFGIPFAGDALVLVYRKTNSTTPLLRTLEDAQALGGPIAFSAADPQALFTLALYQAAGGALLDEEGRPTLDLAILTRVLAFYQQAASSGFAPVWLTQIETPQQAWEAFTEEQASMVMTWASLYLAEMPANTAAAALPTLDKDPFSLANGWVWALASPNPAHQRLSVELAQYLSESSFLAAWTAETGYLPPRPTALEAWDASPQKTLASQVSGSARLIPSTDVQASISPLLEEAALQVLKQQTDAETAARDAVEALTAP